MISKWSIVFLCALGVTSAQNGYSRDNPANQLSYNSFNQQYSEDGDELHGDEIPGEAGRDYPIYSEVPETGFDCHNQQSPGYYADPESQCQAFYICQKGGQSDGFLCPNGTVFNQQYLVCDWWYNFDCNQAEEFYSVNEQIAQAMEEADARLSQQQDGYNYNAPEGNHNGGDHGGRYSGPQPAGLQDPSAVYGVPSGNGNGGHNGRNHGGNNGNGRQQNGQNHSGRHSGHQSSGLQAPNSAYGVPSENGRISGHTLGNGRNNNNGNGRYQGNGDSHGSSNGRIRQHGNGFNGRISSPKPVYGVPSSGNRLSSQYNSINGHNNGFNGNQNGHFGSQGSLNGNVKSLRSEYGVPSGNGVSSQYNSGVGNHNGINRNGNINSPKPVYGVPASGNGGHGNGFNGNQNGNSRFGGDFNGNVDSPKPEYGVPSGNGPSGSDSQHGSNAGHSNGFNGNQNGGNDLIETFDVDNDGSDDLSGPLRNGPSSPDRSYGAPNGASHGPSGGDNGSSHGDDHSAEFNQAPDRSYLPSQ